MTHKSNSLKINRKYKRVETYTFHCGIGGVFIWIWPVVNFNNLRIWLCFSCRLLHLFNSNGIHFTWRQLRDICCYSVSVVLKLLTSAPERFDCLLVDLYKTDRSNLTANVKAFVQKRAGMRHIVRPKLYWSGLRSLEALILGNYCLFVCWNMSENLTTKIKEDQFDK